MKNHGVLRESAEMIPIEPDAGNADAGKYDITEGYDTILYIGQHPKDIGLHPHHVKAYPKKKPLFHGNRLGLGAFSFPTAFTRSISVRF